MPATTISARIRRPQLVVERPAVVASDPAHDMVFQAKAALRAAASVRNSARAMYGAAEREVERLRLLVKRLEGSR